MRKVGLALATAVLLAAAAIGTHASSHREAPGITKTPKVDGTDFYMFRSYEAGRSAYVTLLANYVPLQDAYGGPNFFMLDPDAVYEIHVDNTGDGREDITFQFRFQNTLKELTVPVGDRMVPVPLINIGPIGPGVNDTHNLQVEESYTLAIIRGSRRTGRRQAITNAATGSGVFKKPVDRIGDKSIRDNDPTAYKRYADNHIYDVSIPGCDAAGRVFVGQRREGFAINLAEVFDLINTNPLGPEDGEPNVLADKNVTTLALELPISCLVGGDPVIGAWTTSSTGKGIATSNDSDGVGESASSCSPGQPSSPKPAGDFVPTQNCQGWVPPNHPHARSAAAGTPPGQFTQVSRLGHPLINEVIIGLRDKDAFNGSEPNDDAQFLQYVTHPTLPVLIQALFGVAPPPTPRQDLVQVFLTGVSGLNRPFSVTPAEMLRLNTATQPVQAAAQNRLGVIGGDVAGFPNGRRPGDDVVDIALRVAEGILLSPNPAAFPKLTDGAILNATIAYDPDGHVTGDANFRLFADSFPYLNTPLSGSPNPTHQ